MKALIATVITTIALGIAPAHAEDAWGTVEDAEKCANEFDNKSPHFINGGYIHFDNGKPYTAKNVSPECKAELDQRAAVCLKDPAQVKEIENYRKNDRGSWPTKALKDDPANGPTLVCLDEVYGRLRRQREKAIKDKAEREAALAAAQKVELPKADKKDAALEKQIAAAYKAAYPDNTVLLVLLQAKNWSTERDNWGTITNRNFQAIVVNKHPDGTCELHNELWMQEYIGNSFKGPLLQRGAGSQQLTQILCEKVPGATKPAVPPKKGAR